MEIKNIRGFYLNFHSKICWNHNYSNCTQGILTRKNWTQRELRVSNSNECFDWMNCHTLINKDNFNAISWLLYFFHCFSKISFCANSLQMAWDNNENVKKVFNPKNVPIAIQSYCWIASTITLPTYLIAKLQIELIANEGLFLGFCSGAKKKVSSFISRFSWFH